MAELRVQTIRAPSRGMDTDAAPDSVDRDRAPLVKNLLPGHTGKLVMRGPVRKVLKLPLAAGTVQPVGVVVHGASVLVSAWDGASDRVFRVVNTHPPTIEDMGTFSGHAPLPAYARVGDDTYYLAKAGGTIRRWAGASVAPTNLVDSPSGATDVATYAERLFVLGGTVAGTSGGGGGGGGGSTDSTAPAVPTGLTAMNGGTHIALDWADNIESDLAGYKVYRDTVFLQNPSSSAYNDFDVVVGTLYSYRVSAYDTTGNESAQSSAVIITFEGTAS